MRRRMGTTKGTRHHHRPHPLVQEDDLSNRNKTATGEYECECVYNGGPDGGVEVRYVVVVVVNVIIYVHALGYGMQRVRYSIS